MTLQPGPQRAPLLGFFALTFAWSWACWALTPAIRPQLPWLATLLWGVWHLPLFFIDGTAQARIPLGLFLLSVVAMSVVFAWLVNRTAGSVVAALLFHTAINFWPAAVPVLPTETSYRAYALVVALLVMTALWLLATQQGADVNTGPP